jgi:hypothetical protein
MYCCSSIVCIIVCIVRGLQRCMLHCRCIPIFTFGFACLVWSAALPGGLDVDEERALAWYQRAAGEGGSDIAQSRLGEMYQHGIGVPKDELKAVEWFQKAAEQGSSLGQCCLGEVSREEKWARERRAGVGTASVVETIMCNSLRLSASLNLNGRSCASRLGMRASSDHLTDARACVHLHASCMRPSPGMHAPAGLPRRRGRREGRAPSCQLVPQVGGAR